MGLRLILCQNIFFTNKSLTPTGCYVRFHVLKGEVKGLVPLQVFPGHLVNLLFFVYLDIVQALLVSSYLFGCVSSASCYCIISVNMMLSYERPPLTCGCT